MIKVSVASQDKIWVSKACTIDTKALIFLFYIYKPHRPQSFSGLCACTILGGKTNPYTSR